MRTPGVLIFGLVLAPCGWILDLTSTVSPSWRTVQYITGQPQDLVLQQGLWDICRTFTTSRTVYCNQQDSEYFANQVVTTSQRLMVTSLVINLIGLAVVSAGVKCWSDRPPNWTVTGIGGFLVFFSGILSLIPIAWFTNMIHNIKSPSTDIRVGYCIVLGYMGSLMNVLGGGSAGAATGRTAGRRQAPPRSGPGPPPPPPPTSSDQRPEPTRAPTWKASPAAGPPPRPPPEATTM
uniref:Claudin 23.2 n=1 Tax=Astyanax mexicanus TaxID=7994 RepID=A0A3B1JLC3_ASTMX